MPSMPADAPCGAFKRCLLHAELTRIDALVFPSLEAGRRRVTADGSLEFAHLQIAGIKRYSSLLLPLVPLCPGFAYVRNRDKRRHDD